MHCSCHLTITSKSREIKTSKERWQPALGGIILNVFPSFMVASPWKHKTGLIQTFVLGNIWSYSTLADCSVSKYIGNPSLQAFTANIALLALDYKWPLWRTGSRSEEELPQADGLHWTRSGHTNGAVSRAPIPNEGRGLGLSLTSLRALFQLSGLDPLKCFSPRTLPCAQSH